MVKKLSSVLGCEGAELSVLFTDDREIKKLNKLYRGKNKATDVLSFAAREGMSVPSGEAILGDIVISVQSAVRQAREDLRSVREELLFLLVHGFLHLLGYDHEHVSRAEAARMRRKELELGRLVGIC